ncbi:hypothetical protein ACHAWF_004071 [Thalassiosira exigua]
MIISTLLIASLVASGHATNTDAVVLARGDGNEKLLRAVAAKSGKGEGGERRSGRGGGATNVYGDPLEPCSQPGMAKTGYTRSGQCVDQEGDTGSHHICINLRSASSNGEDFCQVTGQDDWCAKDMPCHEDDGKNCPVERWCVCQWAFAGYLEKAGGCDAIQEIECKAVNIKAKEAYEGNQEKYGQALSCLKKRCQLEGELLDAATS